MSLSDADRVSEAIRLWSYVIDRSELVEFGEEHERAGIIKMLELAIEVLMPIGDEIFGNFHEMRGLRNRTTHEYHKIKDHMLSLTIEEDLPYELEILKAYLAELENEEEL